MENFFKIRAEKQDHIINSALAVFGRMGYKKASVADIADMAGIAKGMVTYYFGSKKNLYLYLCELTQKTIMDKMNTHFDKNETDFFKKLEMGIEIKAAIIKERPALLQFSVSMYYEKDEEVAEEIKKIMIESAEAGKELLINDTDFSKFRDDAEPQMVGKFLEWAGNGLIMDLQIEQDSEKFDEFVKEFSKLLGLMKTVFYKEEKL